MFEQSMLLSSAPGKKAGALAVSLSAQTLAVGTLLLIPLLYTDRLPFAPLQIPTFLPPAPPAPIPEHMASRHSTVRAGHVFTMPTRVPPLNTQLDIIDSAPEPLGGIDAAPIVPLGPSVVFSQLIPPRPRSYRKSNPRLASRSRSLAIFNPQNYCER